MQNNLKEKKNPTESRGNMLHNEQCVDRQRRRAKSNQTLKIRERIRFLWYWAQTPAAVYHCLPPAFQLTCNYSAVWWGWCECGPVRHAGSETFPLCARQRSWHVIHKQRCKQHEYYLLLAWTQCVIAVMNSPRWILIILSSGGEVALLVFVLLLLRINQTVFNAFSSRDAFVTSLRRQSRRILQNPPSPPRLILQSAPGD